MSLTKLSLAGNKLIIPGQGTFLQCMCNGAYSCQGVLTLLRKESKRFVINFFIDILPLQFFIVIAKVEGSILNPPL
jgi:hypothetical protein